MKTDHAQTISGQLANYANKLTYDDLPDDVRKLAHLVLRPRTVRVPARVADVDEVLVREEVDDGPGHREPAEAAVEHADRPLHRCEANEPHDEGPTALVRGAPHTATYSHRMLFATALALGAAVLHAGWNLVAVDRVPRG